MNETEFIIYSVSLSILCLLVGAVIGMNINENLHIKADCKFNSKTLQEYETCTKNPDVLYILKRRIDEQ